MNPMLDASMGITPIDRHAEIRKNNDKLRDYATSESAQYIVWVKNQLLFDSTESIFFNYQQIQEFGVELSERIYLGKTENAHYFSYQLNKIPETFDESDLTNLRSISLLADEEEISLLFHSQGLFNWHRRHQFCASCGGATSFSNAGHSRKCLSTECSREHFPRIDPAVIFSIADNKSEKPRLLLARQANWDEGRYSVIAGFVEPGETLENAVFREAYEEVGLQLESVQYLASQPWPFPSSMMIGFEAVTRTTDIELIDKEIDHAMWVTADEIIDKVKQGKLVFPYSISISWAFINRWFVEQTGYSINEIGAK